MPEISQQIRCNKLDLLQPNVNSQDLPRLRAKAEPLRFSSSAGLSRAALLQNVCLHELRYILEDSGHTQGQLFPNVLPCYHLSAPHQLKNPLLNGLRHVPTRFTKIFY